MPGASDQYTIAREHAKTKPVQIIGCHHEVLFLSVEQEV